MVGGRRRADKDAEALLTDQYKHNTALLRENMALEVKHKSRAATVSACLKMELARSGEGARRRWPRREDRCPRRRRTTRSW